MKKLELHDNIETNLSKNEIHKRLMAFINQNQIKVKEMNDTIVRGMYGSRLRAHTRGIYAEPSILPVKISIDLQAKENISKLYVFMKEGYIGIPPLGMNKKYPKILARLMNNLKLQFYKDIESQEEVGKCYNCGKIIADENQRFCEMCGYELT